MPTATLPHCFCEPDLTLQDLHGDWQGLCSLVGAYLADVDKHLLAMAADGTVIRDVAHRLRTAFGIFHARCGADLSREVENLCKAGHMPGRDIVFALQVEIIGVGEELRLWLGRHPNGSDGDA